MSLKVCKKPEYIGSLSTVLFILFDFFRVRHSSFDIATRYGQDGPGIESRLGRNIPHPSILALGPTQSPIQWVPGLSLG
jgi:hypothetical protein